MQDRKILIVYGSQTGTAQDVAERIWRESQFYNFHGPVMCMDDYSVINLVYETLVVFVASTTGQGEEPENMKNFWKFLLKKNLPGDSLRNVKFGVLGLGDSSYVKFNFVAKRLNRRLLNLGGVALLDPGYADDQHDLGVDAVVDSWLSTLWQRLGGLLQFTAGTIKLQLEARWNVQVVDELGDSKKGGDELGQYSQKSPCPMRVLSNTKTTPEDHFQDVRVIKLSVLQELSYNPGDVLVLVPQNSDQNVRRLFDVLNENRNTHCRIDANTIVQLVERNKDLPVPEMIKRPIILMDCAKKYWDLNAVPRRHVFALLSKITNNDLEKEKLLEFSTAEGQEDLYAYCNRPKRTILEVLADFPHAAKCLTLDMMFDVLQPIKPRYFSIASSPAAHLNEIHILLAVVQYKTKLVDPRKGLCSSYLADLPTGFTLHGWVRPGSFRFPKLGTPTIMIGPGTGVAPFRSYVQELVAKGCANSSALLLFFGCRNEAADFHFREEWITCQRKDMLKMVTAFSRDQEDKVYVQHKIKEAGSIVWDFLQRNGYVMVAGSSRNMPSSVREAIRHVIQEHGGLSPADAELFLLNMEKTGRYQTETWG